MSRVASYYNEIDPYAAAWLRNLIAAGHIADGVVDERSIEDVFPDDLRGFTQCHFFAGIGVWSYALRCAGWPDDRPVWTGSCPCQPFSAAGKGTGISDERHLWPAWHHLIRQCRPAVIFGEQVEAAIAHGWVDLVHDDMEAEDYAFAAFGLPAASVRAPHIRQRIWFVAYPSRQRQQQHAQRDSQSVGRFAASRRDHIGGRSELGNAGDEGLALGIGIGIGIIPGRTSGTVKRKASQRAGIHVGASRMGIANQVGCREGDDLDAENEWCATELPSGAGWWDRADWIDCRDGKRRPVEPGTFPLAHGATARVGRLRGYGNAIVAPLATRWIEACMTKEAS